MANQEKITLPSLPAPLRPVTGDLALRTAGTSRTAARRSARLRGPKRRSSGLDCESTRLPEEPLSAPDPPAWPGKCARKVLIAGSSASTPLSPQSNDRSARLEAGLDLSWDEAWRIANSAVNLKLQNLCTSNVSLYWPY